MGPGSSLGFNGSSPSSCPPSPTVLLQYLERVQSNVLHNGVTYDSMIAVDHNMMKDLEWWTACCNQHNRRSMLQRNENRRSTLREGTSYQLSRASGGVSGTEVICSQPLCNIHFSPPGQHHSNSVPQQGEPILLVCQNWHWRFGSGV